MLIDLLPEGLRIAILVPFFVVIHAIVVQNIFEEGSKE